MVEALLALAGNQTFRVSCAQSKRRAEYMAYWSVNSTAIMRPALHRHGLTGLTLLQILRSRLDNVVFRLGFASSRSQARMMVSHGHFTVNGRRTDVPSMLLSEGDEITVREGSRSLTYFQALPDLAEKRTSPSWLNRDTKKMSGIISRLPERMEIEGTLSEQLIVEYYSRR